MTKNTYIVIRIEEPDFGCEGMPDGAVRMASVILQDETGKEFTREEEDALLYRLAINEGDTVQYENGHIRKCQQTGAVNMQQFLEATTYIDYHAENIQSKASELFSKDMTDIEKAKVAYEYVRDDIPHSFQCNATVITAKASDVLTYRTGICHAKANLLAALLRSQGIPTGFCFQHITLVNDDSQGYAIHAYNAVYLNGKWVKLDANGNKGDIQARFSLDKPVLAYPNREEYDEYFYKGIYASPQMATMQMLEAAHSLQDIFKNIPDDVTEAPDIEEI